MIDRHTDTQKDRQANTQTDAQWQIDRHTQTHTDRQTDRHKIGDRHKDINGDNEIRYEKIR